MHHNVPLVKLIAMAQQQLLQKYIQNVLTLYIYMCMYAKITKIASCLQAAAGDSLQCLQERLQKRSLVVPIQTEFGSSDRHRYRQADKNVPKTDRRYQMNQNQVFTIL